MAQGEERDPSGNPFFEPDWGTPFGAPPFARIRPEHYEPAFARGLEAHRAEIAAIAEAADPPTFANTIEALERSGADLRRVSSTFFNLTGSDTNEALQAIERKVAPELARHRSALFLNGALWARVDALDGAGLDPEQARVLERYKTIFRRAGAARTAAPPTTGR